MNPPFRFETITLPLLIAFALICFAFTPMAQANGASALAFNATGGSNIALG